MILDCLTSADVISFRSPGLDVLYLPVLLQDIKYCCNRLLCILIWGGHHVELESNIKAYQNVDHGLHTQHVWECIAGEARPLKQRKREAGVDG